jgi:hypothetical protein
MTFIRPAAGGLDPALQQMRPHHQKIGVLNRCRTYNATGYLPHVYPGFSSTYLESTGFNLYIVPDDHPTSSQADCVPTPNAFSCPLGVDARRHRNRLDR